MSLFSIHRILVPVDLSETSLNALDTAVALAARHGASLDILNVIEPDFDVLMGEQSLSSLNQSMHSSDILTALAGAIQHTSNVTPRIIQEEGNVGDTITRTALLQHASLVVMGSHGASGFREGFIGSHTYNVLKQAHCPVLVIPPKRKFTSFEKILFPIRPVSSALARFDVVCQFLGSRPQVDVLGLSYRKMERETNVLEKVVDEVCELLAYHQVTTRAVWGNGLSIADDVLQYAHKFTPDLLVITSVLDIINKSNFVGPHTQKIVNCARVPFLSIKKVGVPALA